ncbi:uncharacterized protein [Malus domestica]|uniref:uncharacterized protein n=1 Tax=Malus domestica TaxID=3750 RepID=UPI00397709E5
MVVDNQTIKELSALGLDNAVHLCIQYPTVAQGKTDEFELKSSLLHHIPKYHGLSMEDLNKHLKEFEVVCSSMTPIKVDGNILKMKAFPFSLMDKAKDWLYELALGTVTSWETMKKQYEGVGQRDPPRQHQAYEVSAISELQSQMANLFVLITAKAITLRSGKEVGTNPQTSKQSQKKDEKLLLEEEEDDKATLRKKQPLPQPPKNPMPSNAGKIGSNSYPSNPIPPNIPFPSRFMQSKKEESEKDILETFKKVQVNIPLLDAIKQVLKYAKFLKELCTTRKRISNKEVVWVSENVLVVLQRKVPPKCKDPCSFTIPCIIGNTKFEHAMLDLGASINVVSYSIYASMNLRELKNDGVIIQLADRSNAYPKGVLEDILVQVNHLIFPVDFDVLEMKDSAHSTPLPILLGRLFMKIARTKIDVFKGTLTMEFDSNIIYFNISEAIRYPIDDHSCFSIDVFDALAHDYLESLNRDALETTIAQGIKLITNGAEPNHEESGEMAPTLKLKPLPNHLKYVFLGDKETLPIIVSSSLIAVEEEKLVRVLQEYKTAIGWTLADIKGISPTTCMHCILLEEWPKPIQEAQRRLNPPIMEVVKKEIIKLLDCGVIYPISDSCWVSPVQVVPKKSGVTVVKNEKNELMPIHIQTGWRVCIDYRKLNATTRKYHFPMPFIDQMLERLDGHSFYCFLDGYSGYNQIVIAPDGQVKV